MIVLLLDDSTPFGLIIQLGECSRLVELEFNIVGKFYLIAVPRLIDFHDGHALEVGLHAGGYRCRHQCGRNSGQFAIYLIPLVGGVEVNLCAVGKHHVILPTSDGEVLVGKARRSTTFSGYVAE